MRKAIGIALVIGMCAGLILGRVFAPSDAGASPQPTRPAIPVRFVGTWQTHGGILNINASGVGTDHLRTYVNCTTNRMTACDKFIKNEIYPGQYDTFHITTVTGNTAKAGITDSAYSWRVGTQITILLKPHGIVQVQMPDGAFRYCGSNSPAGACGA
jgi:hypothetical protein